VKSERETNGKEQVAENSATSGLSTVPLAQAFGYRPTLSL
jgi:hypothetical protein